MSAAFDRAVRFVLEREGGFTIDAGGETHYGVTWPFLHDGIAAGVVPPGTTVRDLDAATALLLYRRLLWEPMKCDEMPEPIALALLDTAVNDGRTGAVRLFQGILGVERDGIVGPHTLKAAREADRKRTLIAFCDRRYEVYAVSRDAAANMRGWMRRLFRLLAEGLTATA